MYFYIIDISIPKFCTAVQNFGTDIQNFGTDVQNFGIEILVRHWNNICTVLQQYLRGDITLLKWKEHLQKSHLRIINLAVKKFGIKMSLRTALPCLAYYSR